MSTPSEFFTTDHRRCDDEWAAIEAAVDSGAAAEAGESWQRFDASMRRHFAMEEEVLFPILEGITGMRGAGPTEVMRQEHAQMRGVLDQMAAAASAGEYETLVDHGDTLLMLVQQHNVKEEGILYPMADRMLSDQWPGLRDQLKKY